MRIPALFAGAVLLLITGTAVAQTVHPDAPHTPLPYDRGGDTDTPRTRVIDDAERSAVEAANRAALNETRDQGGRIADNEAQYARDVAAYRAALRGRAHVIAADAAFQARQERAYADAMADWRVQVSDCRRGIRAACAAPTPDPVDY